jgi:hypothetical protein
MNHEKKDMGRISETNANGDPVSDSDTPRAHPIGTGVGAVLGGVTVGAAAGTVVGPVGTVIGAVAGAIVGGLTGQGVAETLDPTSELTYWRENFKDRPYAENANSFDDYGPAYGYGVSSYTKYPGRSFDDVEAELSREWVGARGASKLQWDQARNATRDAWERIGNR